MKKCFFVFLFSLLYSALNAQSMFNNSYRDGRLYDVSDLVFGSNHEFKLIGADDGEVYADFENALFSINNSIITIKYDDGKSLTYRIGEKVKKAVLDYETEMELYLCYGDFSIVYFNAGFEKTKWGDDLFVEVFYYDYDIDKIYYSHTYSLEEK